MLCKKCNAVLSPGAIFCGSCGTRVMEDSEQPTPLAAENTVIKDTTEKTAEQPVPTPSEIKTWPPTPASAETKSWQPTQAAAPTPAETKSWQPTQTSSPTETKTWQPTQTVAPAPAETKTWQPTQAAAPTSTWTPAAAAPTSTWTPAAAAPTPVKKKGAGKIILIIVIVVLALLLLVGGAYFAFSSGLLDRFFPKKEVTTEEQIPETNAPVKRERHEAERTEDTTNTDRDTTPEEESKEPEAPKEPQISGSVSGNVDYNAVNFAPAELAESQVYDSYQEQRLQDGNVLQQDQLVTGTLYSVAEDREMHVEAYFDRASGKPERIVTVMDEEDHKRVYDAYYADGELRMIWDYITKGYSALEDTSYDKNYRLRYTKDRLVELQIDRGSGDPESYLCKDYAGMDSGVQDLFRAREASYLNRAYMTYEAVMNSVTVE